MSKPNKWKVIGNIKKIIKKQDDMDRSMKYPYISIHNYKTRFTDFIKIPNNISRDEDSLHTWLSIKYKLSHIQYMECKGISMDDVTDFRKAINDDTSYISNRGSEDCLVCQNHMHGDEYNADAERESRKRNGIQCATDCED